MIKHPAKFTDIILESVMPYLDNCYVVLDIFAGTGKVAKIKELGFSGKVYCKNLNGLINLIKWTNGHLLKLCLANTTILIAWS